MLILLVLWACGPEPIPDLSSARRSLVADQRLLVLGVDGMDWSVTERLLRRGELPELASLLQQGARIPLASRRPMNSPALWTTMATGVTREEHGVLDFVYLPAEGTRQVPARSSVRRRLAFWQVLDLLEAPSATVGWFVSWPPEPLAHGVLVTDRWRVLDEAAEEPPVAWPPSVGAIEADPDLLEGLDSPVLEALAPAPGSRDPILRPTSEVLRRGRKYLQVDAERARMAVLLGRANRPRLLACYLQGVDALSHFLWKYEEPGAGEYAAPIDPDQRDRMVRALEEAYILADRTLGVLRDVMGREAAVILVSDHGFRPFVLPGSVLVELDLLFEEAGWLRRTPEGRVDVEASLLFPGEGTGIVEPLGTREHLVYRGRSSGSSDDGVDPYSLLRGLRTDSGRPFFAEVRRLEGNAAPGVQPPAFVVRISEEVLSDREILLAGGRTVALGPPLLKRFEDVSGTHRADSVLVARGPGLPAGGTLDETLRPEDLFPLILALAGAPVPIDIGGRLPEGVASATPARVGSYEVWAEEQPAARSLDGGEVGGAADEAMRERLRSLGYIED